MVVTLLSIVAALAAIVFAHFEQPREQRYAAACAQMGGHVGQIVRGRTSTRVCLSPADVVLAVPESDDY